MKEQILKELESIEKIYDNTDRAYILIHNLRLYLDKIDSHTALKPKEVAFFIDCLKAIRDYRNVTALAKFDNKNKLQDGFLNDYWKKIEAGHEKECEHLHKLSQILWKKQTDLLPERVEPIVDMAYVVVDVQNDFSASAQFKTDDKNRTPNVASLPVTKSEDISDGTNDIIFSMEDPTSIIYTRDMHPEGAIWSQIKPGVKFEPEHKFQPLDSDVIKTNPKCGHVCWGRHCTVNTRESDFIKSLALHPDAMYVAKGTNKFNHPYGAAVIDNAVLPEYLKDKGVTTTIVSGWATEYCVADTVKGLIAGDINVIIPTPCCGGIDPKFKNNVSTSDIMDVIFQPDATRLSIEYFAAAQKCKVPENCKQKLQVVYTIEPEDLNSNIFNANKSKNSIGRKN